METEKMSFRNSKDVLSQAEMKMIIGGASWECDCGGGGWNGWGSNADFRDQIIEMGCANKPTYCHMNEM